MLVYPPITFTFWIGWIIYCLGFVVMALSLTEFSKSNSIWLKGIYKFSRNPMYVGYFLIFIGTAVLIGSWFHLALTFIYQIAVHFLVLSEERWCLDNYGETYKNYQEKVPRYI